MEIYLNCLVKPRRIFTAITKSLSGFHQKVSVQNLNIGRIWRNLANGCLSKSQFKKESDLIDQKIYFTEEVYFV